MVLIGIPWAGLLVENHTTVKINPLIELLY
jgi:hypothetical protein